MIKSLASRRAALTVAATLALGIGAPAAGAKPIDSGPAGAPVIVGVSPTPGSSVQPGASHPTGAGVPEWVYVAIGSGVASLALISIGGSRVVSRRVRA
jgi:hypothetical protein